MYKRERLSGDICGDDQKEKLVFKIANDDLVAN